MSRYYIHDLEEDKIHLHTGGKADWLTISEETRSVIKRAFLWSGSRGCWIGRAKGTRSLTYTLTSLRACGFEDRGTEGERLTFAEQVEAVAEKAEARADRMEAREEKATEESRRSIHNAIQMTQCIPMGQPILVGHHSEKRHRALLNRSDNAMRRGVEAGKKAEHYGRRAEAARDTADGSKFSDPRYLGNRIAEAQVEERDILRRLEKYAGPDKIGEEHDVYRTRMAEVLARVRERIEFHRAKLAECGRVFDRESLKGKTMVQIRGRWELIVRLNPTTVAIPNICFPEPESQRKWALKYRYTEVQDAK